MVEETSGPLGSGAQSSPVGPQKPALGWVCQAPTARAGFGVGVIDAGPSPAGQRSKANRQSSVKGIGTARIQPPCSTVLGGGHPSMCGLDSFHDFFISPAMIGSETGSQLLFTKPNEG